jgi:two-component system, chemotaxis family, chemotaxis protein CheY
MKLLLVEDQEHILRLERMVLITDGFDVETASGGREALRKLEGTRYDGLVLDMLMPDVDGCEVVRQVKSVGLNRQTPVIMVTASLEPGMRQRAFAAGAVAFINKPFTAQAFRSVIHSAIRPPQWPDVPTPAAPPGPAPPAPALPAAAPSIPIPVSRTPTPSWRRPRPAVGQVVVRAETGATYSCPPDPRGGWQCGRCELGLITAEQELPLVGSRCSVCHAEVVQAQRGGRRWWPF